MDWVSKVDNQGWPPRPILVSGGSIPGTDLSVAQQAGRAAPGGNPLPPGAPPVDSSNKPIALGQNLFRSVTPACAACHSTAPGVNLAGPTLAGIATTAAEIIKSPDYKGKATTVEEFIHESIVAPSVYLHPGAMYSANGSSFMPPTYGKDLTPQQLDQLVDYLATLK
jgi:nitric oxide reductase subunit C